MPQFKIGDIVVRNNFNDNLEDGNDVKCGDSGPIVRLGIGDVYAYKVGFANHGEWWIRAECVELLRQLSPEEIKQKKEQKVIAKIKYLNEKYAKSRTVPAQVVDAKQGESGTNVASTGCEAPRITTTPISLRYVDLFDENAIRSETARLRGLDAEHEYLRYYISA